MATNRPCLFFFLFVTTYINIVFLFGPSSASTYSVVSYGARGDGETDSTSGFERAWETACKSTSAATVYVPQGSYLINMVHFEGPCKYPTTFLIEGTLVAPYGLGALGDSGYWIVFSKVTDVVVTGNGTIDGRGLAFWACRRSGKNCPNGARAISFNGSNNVTMEGITSLNSQIMHITMDQTNYVTIKNVRIVAPSDSPNTDGVHLQESTFVTISDSTIMTGDDCVSIGAGTKNVWIQDINCGPGHGVSIGSLGDNATEAGVENVTVTNSVFTNTQNGVRIKSWARPSNGYAKNITFMNLRMVSSQNPIIIDQRYCPDNEDCPNQGDAMKLETVASMAALLRNRASSDGVDRVVKALLKWCKDQSQTQNQNSKLLKEDEFVYLVITLKKVPPKNHTDPYQIRLPHNLHAADLSMICLIIADKTKSILSNVLTEKKIKFENIPISKVVKVTELKFDYKSFDSMRNLYD